jgi:hypothetical protein
VREAKVQFEQLACGVRFVTDTYQFEFFFESFAHTDHVIVDQGAIQAVHGTVALLIGGAADRHDIAVNFHFQIGIDLNGKFSLRAFGGHDIVAIYRNGNSGGKRDRLISYP